MERSGQLGLEDCSERAAAISFDTDARSNAFMVSSVSHRSRKCPTR